MGRGFGLAVDDGKSRVALNRPGFDCHPLDMGQWRSLVDQVMPKSCQHRPRPLDFDEHAATMIADKAGQTVPYCQPVNKRPEPNPLDHAGNSQALAFKPLNIRQYHSTNYLSVL